MKEVMGKVKRTLSILLAVAMVVTCVPQTGLSALAANETPGITEAAGTETAEVKVETPESNSEATDEAEAEDAADEEDSTEVIEEGGEAETPADDEQAQEPVVDDEAAEDGESEGVAKDLMDAEPYETGKAYSVTFKNEQGHTVNGNADNTTADADYTFNVTLKDGFKDLVVTAYTGDTLEDNKSNAITVTVDGPNEGVYTCTIAGTTLTAIGEGVTGITIEITATEIQSYTLTIPQAADVAGVSKVEYATVPEGDGSDWKEVGASIDSIEEDTNVYVRVTADEGYTYTVTSQYAGDTEAAEAAKVDGKDYYKFTMSKNLTLTITASEIKTSYEVVVSGANTESDKATLTWEPADLVTTVGNKSTVPADKDLTFKVSVKDTYVETHKINKVTYQIGEDGSPEEITPDEEGVYTIDKAEITDNVTITVATAEYQDYAITFYYDAEDVETPAITAGGKALDTTDSTKWDATEQKATVSEKDEISFKLSMKQTSKCEIDKVTYGAEETPITPAEDGTYTLGKVTKDTTVTVSLKVNEEKANRLTLATEGSARGYSVTFIQDGEIALDKEIVEGNPYRNGDKIVTLTSTFYALITPGKGFELKGATGTVDLTVEGAAESDAKAEKVTTSVDGIEVAEGEKLYKITYTKAAALELKVATTVIPSEAEQTVLFANKSGGLTYAVDLGEKITKKQNTVNTYVVAAGATAFDFTVNAAIGYAPKVSYEDENGAPVVVDPENKDGTVARDGKTKAYKYKLTVGELPNNTVITLDAKPDEQTVSLIYNADEVDITAKRIGARKYDGEENETSLENGLTQVDLKVPHGETVTISAEAYDNCKITNVTTQLGSDDAKKASFKPAGFEVSLKADVTTNKNWSLNITSEKFYAGRLYDTTITDPNPTTKIEPVKNVYTVDYDHTYTVKALHGAYDAAKLGKVEVLGKKSKAAVDGVTVTIAENKESASFTLNANAAAAKDLVVNLYAEGQETTPVVTLALNVLPVITKVTVTGVKNGAVEQTVDTWKDYAVKVDPKTANSGVLHAVVDPAVEGFDVSFDTEENKLWIKTPQTLDQTATVKFYTVPDGKTDVEANRTYIASANGGVFTVTSVAQLSDKVKPTMKLASSDDTTLTLTLGAPKTVVDATAGRVLYEVKITSKGATKDTKDEVTAETNVKAALGTTGTKTFYVPKEVDALSQEETFTVNGGDIGDAWEYNVDVTLVQAKENIYATTDTVPTLIGAKSSTVDTGNKPFATKVPYYEDKLTLKKGTTTIYTGQQYTANKNGEVDDWGGVVIATAQFGKNTTYTELTDAEDDHDDGSLYVYVDGNKVYAIANQSWYSSKNGEESYTALGKHKITVSAKADDEMHSATATIDVTVVEGIESLKVNVPTTSLYKEDKKAASLKATVDYNPGGGKDFAPKTKKVEWSIVDVNGSTDLNSEDGDGYYLHNKVTVKNGNVSVDKSFVVSSDVEDNQFRVCVDATDYYGNETYKLSDVITITNQAQDIGELVLAKWDNDSNGYKVLARDGQTVTAAQLEDAQLYVLRRGTPEKTFQWDDILDAKCFTFTSGNKAIVLNEWSDDYDRHIGVRVDKPAKNVKLTATANDGSKQKVVMTLTVDYDTVNEGELGLKIETWEPSHKTNNPDSDAVFTIDGTTSSQYYATVVKKVGNEWKAISDYTDFKVIAKDAKFITEGSFNQSMGFVNTKKDAKITLTYSVPNGLGKFVKKTRDYTVTNTGYDAAKAPKVTLTGSLIAVYTDGEQVISGTVTPDKSVSGSFKGKQVKVEPDWTAANAKNLGDYYTLQSQLSDCYVDESGKLTLKFAKVEKGEDGQNYTMTRIPAGTYKLKVTTGTWNYDTDTIGGEFVPDSQAASVTLKAVARKVVKGSFKPTTTYTLSMLDSSVTLTGKGKDVKDYNFYILENDNVKGAKNHFTKYFELDTDWDTHISVLKLNSTELSKPEYNGKTLSEIIPAEDRTAYVTWGAHLGTDLSGSTSWYSETVKITVKLTDKTDGKNDSVKKYAASNATVLGDKAVVTANIAITADGKPVEIYRAYADDLLGPGFTSCDPYEGGIVALQSKLKPAVGKHKIDLYIVPADSYWAPVIDQIVVNDDQNGMDVNKTEAAKEQAVRKNGVKLTVTVDVKDPANTKDKIKVGNTNVVFTNEQYSDDGFGNYWADIPYTKVIDCEIDEIKVADPSNALNGLINFSPMQKTDDYENVTGIYISASINKKELSDAISATGSKLSWGQKNIAVKTTVTFKNGSKDTVDYGDEKKAEDITFKVTLPKEPKSTTFADIVKDVKDHQKDIMNVDLPDDWSALDDVNVDDDGYSELDYVVHGIREQVYNNLKAYVPGDSDVKIVFDEDMTYASSAGYEAATTTEEGSLIVPITLVDMTTGTAEKDDDGNVTGYDFTSATRVELESEEGAGGYKFVIPKASLSAKDSTVTSKIGDLMREIGNSEDITISNATTVGDIRAYLREGAKDVLGTNLVLWVTETNRQDATDQEGGHIYVKVIVQNKNGGDSWDNDDTAYDVAIEKLPTVGELATKIDAALAVLSVSNKTTQDDIKAEIEKVIAENNTDVEFAWAKKTDSEDDDFTIVKAEIPDGGKDGVGSITGKIVLTNSKSATGNDEDKKLEHSISIEIPALKKSDEAITAVASAAIGEANAKKFAESNVKATVRQAVLDAANKAVENDPYVVSFKVESEKELFDFKPVKWNEDGEISYTLEVKEEGTEGKVVEDSGSALVQAKITLTKNPDLQTLAEAKAEVEKKLTDAGETVWNSITSTTTEEVALNTVQTTLEGYVTSSVITVKVTKVSFTAATVKAGGELKCTWSLTKEGETPTEPVELTITTEMLAQAKADVEQAAKGAAAKITVTTADFDEDGKADDKQAEIKKAVEDALAEKFTVEVKTDLNIAEAPTLNKDGKATIVFSVKEGAEDESPVEVTCDYTLPELTQTVAEALDVITKAIAALTVTNESTSETVLKTLQNAVETTLKNCYSIDWSKEEGKGFVKTEADGETPAKITGTIVITQDGNGVGTADVDIVIPTEP